MQAKYKVKDYYECPSGETLGYANTWEECKEITRERIAETDGECSVMVLQLIPEKRKYDGNNPLYIRV